MLLGSAERSVAPSISVVRSSPTRAQRGTRPFILFYDIPALISLICLCSSLSLPSKQKVQ
ncbi:MAG: hypothetical protein NZ455_01575 [Bacteroidia bacterium]|nr:hypothetical protein [Bacteroidia bacterium]MDW8347376.1 hypothetical protein [Bacteroidia bacterium]